VGKKERKKVRKKESKKERKKERKREGKKLKMKNRPNREGTDSIKSTKIKKEPN